MELSTARLRLSPLDLDRDVADLHAAYADPVVMSRWLKQGASADLAETRARLAERTGYDQARLWSIRWRERDEVLGLVERVGATSPPGLSWMLRQDAWGQGVMSEAARAVVDHLLGSGGPDRVEAWADATNGASITVARRCGMTERGRFPRATPDRRRSETVVMGRVRKEQPQDLYAAEAVLPVRDVRATLDLLAGALDCGTAFASGDPVSRAGVRIGPWSSSRGLHLQAVAPDEEICPMTLYVHCGAPVGDMYARVRAAGGTVDGPPESRPWGRVEFTFRLPDGHRLVIGGPV